MHFIASSIILSKLNFSQHAFLKSGKVKPLDVVLNTCTHFIFIYFFCHWCLRPMFLSYFTLLLRFFNWLNITKTTCIHFKIHFCSCKMSGYRNILRTAVSFSLSCKSVICVMIKIDSRCLDYVKNKNTSHKLKVPIILKCQSLLNKTKIKWKACHLIITIRSRSLAN